MDYNITTTKLHYNTNNKPIRIHISNFTVHLLLFHQSETACFFIILYDNTFCILVTNGYLYTITINYNRPM